MVKKTKNQKFNQRKIVALAVLTVIFVALGSLTYGLQLTRKQLDEISTVKVAQLIVAAVDNLMQPVPEDARTGERYIAAVRLRLPASDKMDQQLLYSYSPPVDEFKAELNIASRTAVAQAKSKVLAGNDVEATFEAVPELQACSRGFKLTFEPSADNEPTLTFDKQLADGRRLYVYADSGCELNRDSMTTYLQQIESY